MMVERKEDDEVPFWEPCLIFRGKVTVQFQGCILSIYQQVIQYEGFEPNTVTLPPVRV